MKDWKKLLPIFAVLFVAWVGLNILSPDREKENKKRELVNSSSMTKYDDAYYEYAKKIHEFKRQTALLNIALKKDEEHKKAEETATAIAEKVVEILVKDRYADLPKDLASELADQDLRIDKLIKSYVDKKKQKKVVTVGPEGVRLLLQWNEQFHTYSRILPANENRAIPLIEPLDARYPWWVIYNGQQVPVSTACMYKSMLNILQVINPVQAKEVASCNELIPPNVSEK